MSDEATLIQLVKRGNEDAFAELMNAHRDYVLNLFLRRGVPLCDAQELAEQVFVRLWNYRKKLSPSSGKLSTFLFTIAGQVATDFFRSTSRRRALLQAAEAAAAQGQAPFLRSVQPASTTTDEALKVRLAIALLSPAMRDVIELAIYREMPYEQISAALAVPVGTVKSRMHNALKRLKDLLK